MYRGVAKRDPLMIQNKYRGVETPRCPMYRGVKTPRFPMNRGVFFCFLNIQAHVAAFNATLIQKLLNFSLYYTNTVQTYFKLNLFYQKL